MLRKQSLICCIVTIIFTFILPNIVDANEKPDREVSTGDKTSLFKAISAISGIPWEYLAAIDQYEQNIHDPKQEKTSTNELFIEIPTEKWVGYINPNPDDQDEESIQYFGGIGRDGDGDGKADRHNAKDVLITFANYLTRKGLDENQIKEQIWRYYLHPTAVDVISHIAKIYEKFGHTDLRAKSFPIPIRYNYSYRSTWGDRRGWGGLRIHEGTDIFADYGTPVLSTCYGYVELIGWNRYGGWRIGIRDAQNQYHYFAHLNGFRKGLKKGDIVQPGEVIGSVGSSGYGPPGTSGKFPPHLHYGIYRFDGKKTYSFDPYPSLKKWEREARKAKKTK